jgi:hypothetical protein
MGFLLSPNASDQRRTEIKPAKHDDAVPRPLRPKVRPSLAMQVSGQRGINSTDDLAMTLRIGDNRQSAGFFDPQIWWVHPTDGLSSVCLVSHHLQIGHAARKYQRVAPIEDSIHSAEHRLQLTIALPLSVECASRVVRRVDASAIQHVRQNFNKGRGPARRDNRDDLVVGYDRRCGSFPSEKPRVNVDGLRDLYVKTNV